MNQRSVRDLAAFGQMLLGVGQEQATNGLTSAPWSLRGTEPRAVWLMATSGMPAPNAIIQAQREAVELEAAERETRQAAAAEQVRREAAEREAAAERAAAAKIAATAQVQAATAGTDCAALEAALREGHAAGVQTDLLTAAVLRLSFLAAQPVAAVGRTLQSSRYLAAYAEPANRPKFFHQLMGAVHALLAAHGRECGLPAADVDRYFERVQSNAATAGGLGEVLKPAQLMHIAVRLWTTAEELGGRELCAILNAAIRRDEPAVITHVAAIAHAINAHCVTRRTGGTPVRWPAANVTYRGGALPRTLRDFFVAGTQYRAPMFVATSFDQAVAVAFMTRLEPASDEQSPPHQEPTLWTFHFDASLPESRRCVHVNFIDKNDGSLNGVEANEGGEEEFLFTPYSAFTVRVCAHTVPRALLSAFYGAHTGVVVRSPVRLPRMSEAALRRCALCTGRRRRA